MPGPGAAATLLALINLPVALVRGIWFRSFDVFWSDWIYVIALVVFWYWAGREIESRLDRRTQVAIKSPLVRIAIDLLLTASSVSLISGAVSILDGFLGRISFRPLCFRCFGFLCLLYYSATTGFRWLEESGGVCKPGTSRRSRGDSRDRSLLLITPHLKIKTSAESLRSEPFHQAAPKHPRSICHRRRDPDAATGPIVSAEHYPGFPRSQKF